MKTETRLRPPPPPDEKVTDLGGTGPEELTIEIDGESVVLDQELIESPLTPEEWDKLAHLKAPLHTLTDEDGEPTVGMAALYLSVKLMRGKPHWTQDHFIALFELLTAWLSNNLTEAD